MTDNKTTPPNEENEPSGDYFESIPQQQPEGWPSSEFEAVDWESENDFPEFTELEMVIFPITEFDEWKPENEFTELEMESMFPMTEFDEWKPENYFPELNIEITTEITTFDFQEWTPPSEPQQ